MLLTNRIEGLKRAPSGSAQFGERFGMFIILVLLHTIHAPSSGKNDHLNRNFTGNPEQERTMETEIERSCHTTPRSFADPPSLRFLRYFVFNGLATLV